MYRRAFLAGLCACLASRPLAAQPRTDGKQLRIGVLTMRRPEDSSPQQAALIAGLREHGYIDGRNVVIDLPDVRGHEDLLPDAVAGLVRRRADVILIVGPAPLEAARKATKSIPLVMVASSADPVADGVAASLARPGGNITGLAYAEPDRFKKQIELLQVAAPRVRRLTVLWDFHLEEFRRSWAAPLADAGRVLGVHVLDPMRVQDATELPAAFAAMKQQATRFSSHPAACCSRNAGASPISRCSTACPALLLPPVPPSRAADELRSRPGRHQPQGRPVRRPDPQGDATGRAGHRVAQ